MTENTAKNEQTQLSYDELKAKCERYRELALHMIVENIIFNESESRDLTRDLADMLEVTFSSEAAVVMLISIDDYSGVEDKATVIPTVEDVLRECFSVFAFVLFFNAGEDRLGCLLSPDNLHNDDAELLEEELMKEIKEYANDACQILEGEMTISIAISSIDSKASPKQLYRETTLIRDHCNSRGIRVASRADLPKPVPRDQVKLSVSERRFMSSVINREFYAAVSALEEIVDGIISEALPTVEQMRSNVFQRLESVMTICGGELHPDRQDAEIYSTLEALMRAKTFREMKERMFDFFALADDCFGPDETENKFMSVKRFVEKNYKSPSMGAAMIYEYLKFSPSYLSRLVKAETGAGVVELIHSVRITKAKELLEETELSIQEIAGSVGFTNRWTFIRAFRNLEGTTPGAYRERFRQ